MDSYLATPAAHLTDRLSVQELKRINTFSLAKGTGGSDLSFLSFQYFSIHYIICPRYLIPA